MTTTDGPYADARDMYLAHTMFRREFGLMAGLVRGVSAGDEEHTQIVVKHIEVLNMVLHHHHAGEDKHLWPRLLERGSAEVATVVQLMESQHQSIGETTAEVATALGAWRSRSASESGEAPADALDRLARQLDEHTRMEEERALPIVEKCITAADWGAMAQEGAAAMPQEAVPLVLGMMVYEGDPGVIEGILSHLSAGARDGLTNLASRVFATHSKRVHGTTAPCRGRD